MQQNFGFKNNNKITKKTCQYKKNIYVTVYYRVKIQYHMINESKLPSVDSVASEIEKLLGSSDMWNVFRAASYKSRNNRGNKIIYLITASQKTIQIIDF